MRWNSFRVRLTLWNVAVLALVLGGFGLALCASIQSRLSRNIDQELADRAHRFAFHEFRPHSSFRGQPGHPRSAADPFSARLGLPGPAQPDARPAPSFPAPRAFPLPGPPGFRPPPNGERGQQSWPFDAEAERRASFVRPRLMNLKGEVLGPPTARAPWDPRTVPIAIAGHERYSTVRIGGDRVRVLSTPWYHYGQIVGAFQVARDMSDYDRLWHGQVGTLLALLPLSLLVAGMGGLFLTERALRPVHQVTQAAAQIGAEDLSRRLEVNGRDELAELAGTFNGMIARLEAAFEQQRRFTADASHELRTPLARIKVSTSMALADEQSPAEYRTALRIADQAADAMERLIQQLLMLARAEAGQLPIEHSRLDLREVLQDAVAAVAREGAAPVALVLPPEPVEINGDADHLSRVFVNLLDNALRHTPPEGQITLWAGEEGNAATVQVRDTGEGIPPEHLPHVGEPFYRVDAARARGTGGCGLGLAISQTIVQAHGGQLSLASEVGQGTIVTVSFPHCDG